MGMIGEWTRMNENEWEWMRMNYGNLIGYVMIVKMKLFKQGALRNNRQLYVVAWW